MIGFLSPQEDPETSELTLPQSEEESTNAWPLESDGILSLQCLSPWLPQRKRVQHAANIALVENEVQTFRAKAAGVQSVGLGAARCSHLLLHDVSAQLPADDDSPSLLRDYSRVVGRRELPLRSILNSSYWVMNVHSSAS